MLGCDLLGGGIDLFRVPCGEVRHVVDPEDGPSHWSLISGGFETNSPARAEESPESGLPARDVQPPDSVSSAPAAQLSPLLSMGPRPPKRWIRSGFLGSETLMRGSMRLW